MRPPDPSSSDWGPSIRATWLSALTVTVNLLLRVTVSSTDPRTCLQSSRSVVGSTGPPVSVGDVDGSVDSGDGVGSGGVDDSDVVQAVSARPAALAASRRRTTSEVDDSHTSHHCPHQGPLVEEGAQRLSRNRASGEVAVVS